MSQNDDVNLVLSQNNKKPFQNATQSKQKSVLSQPSVNAKTHASTKQQNLLSQFHQFQLSQAEPFNGFPAPNQSLQTQELQRALEDVAEENSIVFPLQIPSDETCSWVVNDEWCLGFPVGK